MLAPSIAARTTPPSRTDMTPPKPRLAARRPAASRLLTPRQAGTPLPGSAQPPASAAWGKHGKSTRRARRHAGGPRLRVAHKRLRVHGPDGPARVPRAPPGQRGGALQAARQVALRPAQLPRQRRLHLGRAPAAGVRPALLQQAWGARRRGQRPRQLFCVDECGLSSRLARPPKHWQTSSSFSHLLLPTKIIRPAARRMPRQRAAAAHHDLICFKTRHPAARRARCRAAAGARRVAHQQGSPGRPSPARI